MTLTHLGALDPPMRKLGGYSSAGARLRVRAECVELFLSEVYTGRKD